MPSALCACSGLKLRPGFQIGGFARCPHRRCQQSLFDSRKNRGENAITPLSGSFSWEQTALSRPTPGIAFDFRFGYQSGNAFSTNRLEEFDPFENRLGIGWRHSFEVRVLPPQFFDPHEALLLRSLGLMDWTGSIETWERDTNSTPVLRYFTRHKEYRGELSVPLDNPLCEWVTPERLVYRFRNPFLESNPIMIGRLVEIRDFNSNSVKLLWDEVNGRITQAVDTVSGKYDFRYKQRQRLN